MQRFRSLFWVFLVLAPLVALASCGDDDKKPTQTTDDADLPEIPAADVTTDVEFGSEDEHAVQAEGLVDGQLGMINAYAAMGQAYTAPLTNAHWQGGDSEHCWEYVYGSQGCSWAYEVCEALGIYEWTIMLDGDCGETPYNEWLAMRGTTNDDGTTGTMRVYEVNTTVVAAAWVWDLASDRNSGDWTWYEGDVSSANVVATLAWARNFDGTEDATWTMLESLKWVTHLNAGGTSGWMELYAWEATGPDWWLSWEITWNGDGTGAWVSYDEDGSELITHTWGG
jgi:hypothetical protein